MRKAIPRLMEASISSRPGGSSFGKTGGLLKSKGLTSISAAASGSFAKHVTGVTTQVMITQTAKAADNRFMSGQDFLCMDAGWSTAPRRHAARQFTQCAITLPWFQK